MKCAVTHALYIARLNCAHYISVVPAFFVYVGKNVLCLNLVAVHFIYYCNKFGTRERGLGSECAVTKALNIAAVVHNLYRAALRGVIRNVCEYGGRHTASKYCRYGGNNRERF